MLPDNTLSQEFYKMAQTQRNLKMKTVRVEKEKLLETLKKNRSKHTKEYEEASEGYRDKLIDDYKKFIDKISDALNQLANTTIALENITLHFQHPSLIKPEDHTTDYSTAIEMLEWSVDDHVDLEQYEFEQFVQDKWDWTNLHATATVMYSKVK